MIYGSIRFIDCGWDKLDRWMDGWEAVRGGEVR